MKGDSTARSRKKSDLPKKPYKDFPLRPHASGMWVKKIRGVNRYFGRWGRVRNGVMERVPGDGWKEALDLFQAQRDDLYAGRTPRATPGEGTLSVGAMCNRFLTSKQRLLDSGEIAQRTFGEYKDTTDRLVSFFGASSSVDGLRREDFDDLRADIAKTWGPVRLGNEVVRIRSVFKHGRKSDCVPDEFKKPSAKVLRRHRAKKGKKLFSAEEIRSLLGIASVPMKAMILLGVNAALGNSDCAELPIKAIDLKTGWLDFPRPKTGVKRRCSLWPETVEALRAALESRPEPFSKEHNGLAFVTVHGNPWIQDKTDAVGQEFGKLLKSLALDDVEGRGFYALRHCFRTVARKCKDQEATQLIMGHVDDRIDAQYIEEIDDEDLVAVTDFVRAWLFAPTREAEAAGGAA